jgi:hypothetical protein
MLCFVNLQKNKRMSNNHVESPHAVTIHTNARDSGVSFKILLHLGLDYGTPLQNFC